jgi:cytochrome c-type biogenesis protein CcmF
VSAEIGRTLVLLALVVAGAGAVLGFAAGRRPAREGLDWTRRLAALFGVLLVAANLWMEKALLAHDFSVSYVAQVGSRASPLHITLVSLWSCLVGSILFWGGTLGLYVLAWLRHIRDEHEDLQGYTLATVMAVGVFFCFLIAGPANPFQTVPSPVPTDGPGPNPLLQNHVLMIVHPPMLYAGYVGMTIPFAMGFAALLRGRIGPGWMRALRFWMLVPWTFLTAGIVLGGWWAYEVLGWGGYWAWDPVENASFLPWLTASAFLHVAMLEERRGILRGWTMALLMVTFALTILGTFMTRSGVFNSVHSFTQSPIGPIFLGFLAVVIVAALVLLSMRMHLLEPDGEIRSPTSREGAFVVNNLLFSAFTFTVLVGTVFPLLAEAIRDVKISVGAPFFNGMSLPIAVTIVFLMGVGPALPWGRASPDEIGRSLGTPLIAAALVTGLAAAAGVRHIWPAVTVFVASFAMAVAVREMAIPVQSQLRKGMPGGRALAVAWSRGRRRYGGQIVHVGVAVFAVSIALSGSYQRSVEAVLRRGESLHIGAYDVRFAGSERRQEPHRSVIVAKMEVERGGTSLGVLEPAMNHYRGEMSPIGTPAVRSTALEDLYLSIMHVDEAGTQLGLRALVNPAVPWLWVAAGIMLLGSVIAAWPARAKRAA